MRRPCYKSQIQAKSQFCAVCPYLLLTQLGGGCEFVRGYFVSPFSHKERGEGVRHADSRGAASAHART